MSLLTVSGLKKYFPIKQGMFSSNYVKAVDDVSFHIEKGETLGLVGESGCGKSTAGRTILRLHPPTDGKVVFDGEEVTAANIAGLRRRMQIVFQDPYSSLNPRMTVGDIVGEPLDIQKAYSSKKERDEKILAQLQLVGLNTDHLNRYPHEFSGGQRQRISIARALAIKPDFIVCDEPVSALDVSIQAQILNLIMDLREKFSLTMLFISHEMTVVRFLCDKVAVMYLGTIVEQADTEELFKNLLHPYTQALMSAIPLIDPDTKKERIILEGDIPSAIDLPPGCPFAPRCRHCTERCREEKPELRDVGNRHLLACHLI